ncbi:MAG: type II toxin-antitoxin system HicA family toxin [Candidatus Binatia bacterium]
MAVDEQLLARARRNPAGVAFAGAVSLAQQLGWQEVRIRGSHHIFHHSRAPTIRNRYPQPLNLQEGKDGKAKEYQVRQMIDMAIAMGLISNAE